MLRPAKIPASLFLIALVALAVLCWQATAQPDDKLNSLKQSDSESLYLAKSEARLADRFQRLELLAGRLSELSRATQPRRSRLLRELVAKSRERGMTGRFKTIVESLREENLGTALESQTQLQTDLQILLDLLLHENRDRQIESERKRVLKYLAEIKKLIRLQRGLKARTDGGEEVEQLGKEQALLAQKTAKLRKSINVTEGGQNKPGEKQDETEPWEQEQQQNSGPDKPSENDDGNKPSEQRPPGQPSQDVPSEEGESGKPKESSGDSQPGQGPSSQNDSENHFQRPADRATERLQRARQRMQQAQERLEKSQRDESIKSQEKALRELEQAKAELERILRQLREEEKERMLMLLDARFRRMLDAQIEVYEKTKKLDVTRSSSPSHEVEIASGRLHRKEREIAHEADRALILLREDGTSVAFPEAIKQARDDMVVVAERLRDVKLGLITQGMEEDIIATLEETLAALQKALKELREQRARQQQSGSGEPSDQALVNKLAELRMIRSLQQRINRRTQSYDEMIEGEQALETELLEALDRLSLRQERVWRATHDLDTGRNQ